MKNFKKLTAAVAATLMAATMVAPMAFAAEGDATADNTNTGNKPATIAETDDEQSEEEKGEETKAPEASATGKSVSLGLPTEGLPDEAEIIDVKAYQVFEVEFDAEHGAAQVTGWAADVNSDGILKDLGLEGATADAVAKTLTSDSTGGKSAENFAKIVMNNLAEGAGTAGTVNNGGKTAAFSGLPDGYYAMSCTVKIEGDEESDEYTAKSLGMLTVFGGAATNVGKDGVAKIGLPKVQKKVYEDVKKAEEAEPLGVDTDTQWNDVADYDIGDEVPFKLYGTMPENLDMYEKYFYQFNDKLDEQFTADKVITHYIVKIDKTEIEVGADKDCKVTVDDDNNITVTFADIKAAAANAGVTLTKNSIVTVEYKAVLSSAANVGTPGQRNEVYLTYSNNPNLRGDGDWDKPENKGKTPKDKVIVYTYALKIDKDFFESSGTKLDDKEIEENTFGAVEFKLYKGDDKNALKFSKSDEAEYDYVVDPNGTIEALNLTLVNDELVVRIKGLDDGTYTLKETDGPKGYNLAPDQQIKITATTNEEQDWAGTEEKLTKFEWSVAEGSTWSTPEELTGEALENATAKALVENRKGTALPTTGGVGTRLFYFFGGAMVAIAGVSLITKKRMGKNQIL